METLLKGPIDAVLAGIADDGPDVSFVEMTPADARAWIEEGFDNPNIPVFGEDRPVECGLLRGSFIPPAASSPNYKPRDTPSPSNPPPDHSHTRRDKITRLRRGGFACAGHLDSRTSPSDSPPEASPSSSAPSVCVTLVLVIEGPPAGNLLGSRPAASSASVRARMSKQRRRDTQAELRVRQILHARGIRYRVDVRPAADLRCKADLMWRGLGLVVFIDGCFWHGCPDHATRPRANKEWWARKLDGNIQRDRRLDAELTARGWTVIRFWEHEDSTAVADAITVHLEALRHK